MTLAERLLVQIFDCTKLKESLCKFVEELTSVEVDACEAGVDVVLIWGALGGQVYQ